MFEKFDLIMAFVGSAACSPVLEAMLDRNPKWDPRFFFSHWNQNLVEKLLEQQEKLKKKGVDRHILILVDDVVLSSKDEDQLAHMCLRGRHFNVSVIMCAVSYTSINKKCRRSLDFLLCYSCPMQGDMKILSWEYASNSSSAGFALNGLEEHQCVVFETSRKRQKLFNWRAQLLTPADFRKSTLPVLVKSERGPSHGSYAGHRRRARRKERSSPSEGTRSSAIPGVCREISEQSEPSPSELSQENVAANPPINPVSNELTRIESEDGASDSGH